MGSVMFIAALMVAALINGFIQWTAKHYSRRKSKISNQRRGLTKYTQYAILCIDNEGRGKWRSKANLPSRSLTE